MGYMRVLQFTLFGLLLASCSAYAQLQYNLSPGITANSQDIYNLHMTVFWVCVAIGVVVFGVMIYAMIFHRKSRNAKAEKFHEHLWIEIIWTVIPFLILIGLAIPGTRVLLNLNDTEKSDITIKITGYQWKWKYEYLDYGISFFSNLSTPYAERIGTAPKNPHYLMEVDHVLVVPTHKKVRFLLTSNDVIHSWWVPAFGVKRDAVPGYINESWARINKPGIYHGQCVQLCGVNHAFMPIVVEAKNAKEFDAWVKQQGGAIATETLPKPEVVTGPPQITGPMPQVTGPVTQVTGPVPQVTGPVAQVTGPVPQVTGPVTQVTGLTPQATGPTQSTSTATSSSQSSQVAATTDQPQAPASNQAPVAPKTPPSTTSTPNTSTTTSGSTPSKTSSTPLAPAPTATLSQEELMKHGEEIYQTICAACHQPNGEGMPPVYPSLKDSPLTKGPLNAHLNVVVNGRPGTAMQAFKDQLSDSDIAAVVTFERNSWGHNEGPVQPAEVAAIKAQGAKP
jgi:cytochrome c oxidase subunit 2